MQFGIFVATKIDDWQLIKYAEDLGYDRAWVPDSQMIWSDCYATLALAAVNTKRIQLGTGVAIPGTRLAPVTAHSIASIARLAPGRVFLGIGTGHTAMRVMGSGPVPPTTAARNSVWFQSVISSARTGVTTIATSTMGTSRAVRNAFIAVSLLSREARNRRERLRGP